MSHNPNFLFLLEASVKNNNRDLHEIWVFLYSLKNLRTIRSGETVIEKDGIGTWACFHFFTYATMKQYIYRFPADTGILYRNMFISPEEHQNDP